MENDPFKEYILELEPTKKELGYSWYTAIGLQKVDGLETSDYLKTVAIDNIDGNITIEKVDINDEKVDIRNKKVDIETLELTLPMRKNIVALFKVLSKVEYFGRSEIVEVLNMSFSGASKLISKLLDLQIIIPVFGHGKGKYCFNITGVNYE